MRIAILDSTAVVATGPGSPAYFSRFLVPRLRARGHEVIISQGFNDGLCGEADLTITEWANEDAFAAAASGVCKRLVVRIRGFDAHGPLDKLNWENVDAVVFESPFLRDFVEIERGCMSIHHAPWVGVIPSGIDLTKAPFVKRAESGRPIVALAARATNDKGLQLIYEWARQRPEVEIHMAIALMNGNPRVQRYLDEARPPTVQVHHGIEDVPVWLNEIEATHILSASLWETLGYTIVEGMAVGCRPLIHRAPGTRVNWPGEHLWTSFDDLDNLVYETVDSDAHRAFVAERYDAEVCSQKFIDLVESIPARNVDAYAARYAFERGVLAAAQEARENPTKDIAATAALVEEYRRRWPAHGQFAEFRYMAACDMAAAYAGRRELDTAAIWACRAMLEAPWPDAMCVMGEIAQARGDVEHALAWYRAANVVDDPPKRYRMALVDKRAERHAQLRLQLDQREVALMPTSVTDERFFVVVTVRNGEKWMLKCLQSIAVQTRTFHCLVIDDMSTDGTSDVVRGFIEHDKRFSLICNTERKYQARNTVEGARLASAEDDIVVLVDGDDWLEPNALEVIEEQYRYGAWMTYGNFWTSSGKPSHFGPYPWKVAHAGTFSSWSWQATAPRTFRRFLLDQLTDDDFKATGEWPKVAGDVSVILPMLELARERAFSIREPIYVYNDETPDSDHKMDAFEQVRVRDVLMGRTRKERLERP